MFKLLSARQTGISFANTIATNDTLNLQNDYFIYNGGGVGAADFDGDGRPDLFFVGNLVPSRLYLNRGDMHFEDVTAKSGIVTKPWAGGVAVADVNNDGLPDVYVSVSGTSHSTAAQRANQLFINQGDDTFVEQAAAYGVADTSYSTQAAFLDYDRDGCLDLFVVNNSPREFAGGAAEMHPAGIQPTATEARNRLYHNDCHGHFMDVSDAAGIVRKIGYGLGVAIADVNRDGWPDIYVSNDDTPNDVLYINNHDGTFTDRRRVSLKHTSFAGMGVDVADFNNDGWPDVVQSDMLPDSMSLRKSMSGGMTYQTVLDYRDRGFRDDYQVNSLQLSNGVTDSGTVVFSEIGHLAGVSNTDWSWSSTFADFDNDGFKDILITNGYPMAVNEYDYQSAMFAIKRARIADREAQARGRTLLNHLRAIDVPNFAFRNNGDLTFTNVTAAWGMLRPSISSGAAQVDLNGDGTLDVVENNINGPAFIYENVLPRDSAHHFLTVKLRGDSLTPECTRRVAAGSTGGRSCGNRAGLGAQLVLTAGGQKQYVYYSPFRGYMSTVDDRAHFGLGRASLVDSLEIYWPDGRYQLLTHVSADTLVVVDQARALDHREVTPPPPGDRVFHRLDARQSIAYAQRQSQQLDWSVQPLLPYLISRQGPTVAVADVDGDGLEDVFVGGGSAVHQRATLFLQRPNGAFVPAPAPDQQPFTRDSTYEDWGAVFFDANGDGRPDLYVASGGYQFAPASDQLQDRLYINAGHGRFVRDTTALPRMLTSTSAVRAGDFTGDGKPDLFVGGRVMPRAWPMPTRSYLLRNDGGHFTDVTAQYLPALAGDYGMVTDAAWIDFDGDGKLDLVTAGEWMPLTFYRNEGGHFRDVTASMHLRPLRGWWFSLAVADVNGDGRPDIIAGNLGDNVAYRASPTSRFGVVAADLTHERVVSVILTQMRGGKEYPYFGLAKLGPSIYTLGFQARSYERFASETIQDIFGTQLPAGTVHYQADTFSSVVLLNTGTGFTVEQLPSLAQASPIRGIVPTDVDGDGKLDLVVAGNQYNFEPNTPPADAGNGLWLRGDGHGHFTAIPPVQSGLLAPGDVAGLALVNTRRGRLLLVPNTGDSLLAYSLRGAGPVRPDAP
jgi:hypothetical protein